MQQPEVNASSVIEETRPTRSFWSTLTQPSARPAPASGEAHPAPERITLADFAGFISQVRQARKRAELPEEKELDGGSEAAAAAEGGGGSAAAAAQQQQQQPRLDAFAVVPAEFFDPSKLAYELNDYGTPIRDKDGEPILVLAQGVLEAHLASNPSLPALQARMVEAHDRVLDDLHVNVQGRAPQFFLALREMEDLQQRVVAGNVVATSLRRNLQRLKRENCVQPLAMIAHHRRRRRKASLLFILRQLREVLLMPAAALRQLHSGEQGAALDTVLAALAIIRGPLAHLTCLEEARKRLEALQQSIAKQLIAQLTRACLSIVVIGAPDAQPQPQPQQQQQQQPGEQQLEEQQQQQQQSQASQRSAADGPGMALEAALQTSVRPLLEGLVRLRVLGEALESVQVSLVSELKEVVRSEVREAVLAAEMGSGERPLQQQQQQQQQPGSSALTLEGSAAAAASGGEADRPERLQALSPASFVSVVTAVCSGLLDVLRRLQAMHELVERVLDMSSDYIAAAPAGGEPEGAGSGAGSSSSSSSSGDEAPGSAAAAAATVAASTATVPTWESIDAALGLAPAAAGAGAGGGAGGGGGALLPPARAAAQQAHIRTQAERTVEVQRWRAMASAVLKVATDGVQRHVSRLLSVRRSQSTALRVSDMRRLYDAATSFTTAANAILSSASSAAALSLSSSPESYVVVDECLGQVKGLLAAQHAKNSATLSALLDADQWKQAEVPRQVQRIADAISSAVSSSLPPQGLSTGGGGGGGASALVSIQRATEGEGVGGGEGGSGSAGTGGGGGGGSGSGVLFSAAPDSAPTLSVGGCAFPIVNSAVMLVKMLGDYSNVTESFPDVAAEAIVCTVQLLRSFNARAHELILEAKASKQFGGHLSKITGKQLALTSQSLGAILSLLPALRALLLMRLAPHQHMLLSDLAAVTADLLAHDSKIRAKLVAIVRELMAACCTKMRAIPWGNPNAAMTIPSTPMTEFITGTTTLHGILMGVYRREQVADVYARVLAMANSHLPGHYAVLVAHLATTAAAAAAAAAAAVHAGGAGSAAAAAAVPPPFDRAVALQRMGGDLRLLLEQFQALLEQPGGGSGSGSGSGGAAAAAPKAAAPARPGAAPSAAAAEEADSDLAASLGASREALQSLQQWMQKEFGGGSAGSPARGRQAEAAAAGEAAAAAAAAAEPAATSAAAAAPAPAPTPAAAAPAAEAAAVAAAGEEGVAAAEEEGGEDEEDAGGDLAAEALLEGLEEAGSASPAT